MSHKFSKSITARIISLSILPVLFACSALTVFYLDKRSKESQLFLETRGTQLTKDLAAMSEFGLATGSTEYLDETLSSLIQQPEIHSITILDEAKNIFLSKTINTSNIAYQKTELLRFESDVYRLIKPIDTFDLDDDLNIDTPQAITSINKQQQLIGYVIVEISPHLLRDKQRKILLTSLFVAFLVLLVSTIIGMLSARSLLKPIKAIVSVVNDLRKGDYRARIRLNSQDELATLADNIDKLASELGTSKEEVTQKMVELTEARENADRANATKSMFMARVSHELRNPLAAIIGNLEILQDTEVNEYQNIAIRLAEKNSEFLLRQIEDILEFGLLEASQYKTENQSFDISGIVETVSNITKLNADQKNINYKISLTRAPNIDNYTIISDPIRVQQILINLIGNAIKFTHTGEVVTNIHIEQEESEKNNIKLKIEVIDTGIGIPQDKQHSIFNSFEQVHSPISRDYDGVGLGLSITKYIVEAMDGTITVKSELDKGSKFIVTLPVKPAAEIKPNIDVRQETHSIRPKPAKKILLVEDNADNQRVVSTLLHNIDIKVDIANNGVEGLEKYSTGQYDLIFVDCFMPTMDGFTFTKRIRELESNTQAKTIIIGLTAGAHKENIEQCYTVGMDDVITKPFYRVDLYRRVLGLQQANELIAKINKD